MGNFDSVDGDNLTFAANSEMYLIILILSRRDRLGD